MFQYINTSLDGGVGRLTLNRPEKRNALRRDFINEIKAGLDCLAADASLRVLVLNAKGSVFCAGMDLGEMQQRAQAEDGNREWLRDSQDFADVMSKIYAMDVPTVAIVQGPALAGGMGLVLACDMVIASENVFLLLPEPARGITAAMVTPLLIHRVGTGLATFMLLSGERVTAARAAAFGIFHDVVPVDELVERSEVLIGNILSGSKSALAITKQHIMTCTSEDVLSDIKTSISVSATARETDDAREGLAAFLEKRKPEWQPQ